MEDVEMILKTNSDRRPIANYIINKFKEITGSVNADELSNEDLKKLVDYIQAHHITASEVERGLIDNYIVFNLKRIVDRDNSVKKTNETPKKVPFKARKKGISKTIIALSISATILVGGSILVDNASLKTTTDKEIGEYIGMIASEPGSEDFIHQRNIPIQNKELANANLDNSERNIFYNTSGMARDIMTVCTYNPDLFDITLYNCYFESENRLTTMDRVLKELQNVFGNEESIKYNLSLCDRYINDNDIEKYVSTFKNIYESIKDYRCFLDYMSSKTNSIASPEVKSAIEEYLSKERVDGSSYNALSEESKRTVDELRDLYKNNKKALYKDYGEELKDIATSLQDADPAVGGRQ